ncbi:MAG TPA: hypothetical protein VH599_02180 [Ktedonobacterales bacterium]|jgi:sterol desaturase/sphingolipid hydroxylase (fatty acid hydroxylase superfamily)
MRKNTWLKEHRWLLGGLLLACLALAIVLIIWAVGAHQYQLALAHYNATYPPPKQAVDVLIPNPPPPIDTSAPGAWGWPGWTIRTLAVFLPALLGLFLHWREHRPPYMRIHKKHLDHATNKLAEAIGVNQELPEGVFDAYSKLRELEKRRPPV